MIMRISDWGAMGNNIIGEDIMEMAGEDTKNIIYMCIEIPKK